MAEETVLNVGKDLGELQAKTEALEEEGQNLQQSLENLAGQTQTDTNFLEREITSLTNKVGELLDMVVVLQAELDALTVCYLEEEMEEEEEEDNEEPTQEESHEGTTIEGQETEGQQESSEDLKPEKAFPGFLW
jgi:peptidoglycan hydrolase CwlO-like protein